MKTKLVLPALVLLAFALPSCGSSGDSTETSGESAEATATAPASGDGSAPAPSGEAARAEKVDIADFAYDPEPVTIQVGGKVTWMNEDSVAHTATADDGSFDTGTIEQGKIQSETFKEPGTFTYHCEIHRSMHGTVEVVEKD